jgi:prevent-host-death family protein
MIDLSQDMHSLTDFKRKTSEFLKQLKGSGAPVVLTVKGKAEVVVQDAAAYQKLLELVEQSETVRTLRERLAAARRGEGRPVDEFFEEMYEKHGLPREE